MKLSRTATAQPPATSAPVVIARRPIYDRRLSVYAYELVVRDGEKDDPQSTARTVVAAITDIGLDTLSRARPSVITASNEFLHSDFVTLLPPERVILSIADPSQLDEKALAGVETAAVCEVGVIIPLADQDDRIGKSASIVTLDVRDTPVEEFEENVRRVRAEDKMLLGMQIDDHHMFEICRRAGFDLFCGPFFCRPKTLTTKSVSPNKTLVMNLVAQLQDPTATLEQLDQAISRDVAVSYRLLRWINSAYYSLPRKVRAVREALLYLGVDTARNLATMVALASLDGMPSELSRIALTRARMCELVAKELQFGDDAGYFTVGLFSVLDAMLETLMEQAISPLPLSSDIRQALLSSDGHYGEILSFALAYEQGQTDLLPRLENDGALRDCYLHAIRFADEALGIVVAPS